MAQYIIKKILQGLLMVIAVSILVFSMLHLMPGDPIDLMVDRKVPLAKREAKIGRASCRERVSSPV